MAKSGKSVDRANVRNAIQETTLETIQGEVSFDANGDLKSKAVSIFQVQYDANNRWVTSSTSSGMWGWRQNPEPSPQEHP